MKRLLAISVTGLLLFTAAPVIAGEDGPVTLSPNPVRLKKTLHIEASDCVSGDGWTAYVVVEIFEESAEGTKVFHAEVPADDSGVTNIDVRLSKSKFSKGVHVAFVDCIHEFDDGGTGTWYETDTEFRVKKARKRK